MWRVGWSRWPLFGNCILYFHIHQQLNSQIVIFTIRITNCFLLSSVMNFLNEHLLKLQQVLMGWNMVIKAKEYHYPMVDHDIDSSSLLCWACEVISSQKGQKTSRTLCNGTRWCDSTNHHWPNTRSNMLEQQQQNGCSEGCLLGLVGTLTIFKPLRLLYVSPMPWHWLNLLMFQHFGCKNSFCWYEAKLSCCQKLMISKIELSLCSQIW